MIILIKLLLAHFIGDFLLQPKSWIEDKENRKAASWRLYLHLLIHGLLVMLVLWSFNYWLLAVLLMLAHGVIDLVKLYSQTKTSRTRWFIADQVLHLATIVVLWHLWFNDNIHVTDWIINPDVWIYTLAILFITSVTGVIIQVLLSGWSDILNERGDESLSDAGRYIGILERLFVFTFVVTNNWQAIGFLLAAKSVFRFGDLKDSKDRKLTEYILIGTLLSFGIAVLSGLIVLALIEP